MEEDRPKKRPANLFETGTDPADPELLSKFTEEPQEETAVAVAEPPEGDQDAQIEVFFGTGSMKAEMLARPPYGEGKPLDKEDVSKALQEHGIVYGLVTEGIVELLGPVYDKKITVAVGTDPEDGQDGICEDLFPRQVEKKSTEREDGTIDYRELGLINDVRVNTPVCKITPATEGADGTNVLGKPVKARAGKKPSLPVGEGTQVSPDGLYVETTRSGNLVFRDGRFHVDTVFRVQNIDYEVGNITFSGDVQVEGEIQDGFEIHTGGNVTVRGRVGASVIEAEGSIVLEQGVNGMGKAVIDARKTVTAGFIENSTVRAGEKITAGSIINSQVECEGDVDVTIKHGTICGGKVTAFGSITANEIGNESNTLTVLVMGVTPKLIQERRKLTEKLADVSKHMEELIKNVTYVERLVEEGRKVSPERVQILQRTKLQLPMTERKQTQLQKELDELEEKINEVNSSFLSARVIYPPTKISIGALSTNCIEVRNNCKVYRNSRGELVFGSR